jgi:hypothetical protein
MQLKARFDHRWANPATKAQRGVRLGLGGNKLKDHNLKRYKTKQREIHYSEVKPFDGYCLI